MSRSSASASRRHHHPRRPRPRGAEALPFPDRERLSQRRDRRRDVAARQQQERLGEPRLIRCELAWDAGGRLAVAPHVLERLRVLAGVGMEAGEERQVEQEVQGAAALGREPQRLTCLLEGDGAVAAPPCQPGAQLDVRLDVRRLGERTELALGVVEPVERQQVDDAVAPEHVLDREAVARRQRAGAVHRRQRVVRRAEAPEVIRARETANARGRRRSSRASSVSGSTWRMTSSASARWPLQVETKMRL
jgi:hypothetical protein